MAYYNLGIVVKLTRTALGMSQEELCDGICSVQTLSHIENGKHSVKRETYRQLMERMGRCGEKNYPSLSTDNLRMLDMMLQTNMELNRYNYEQLQGYLQKLRSGLLEHPFNEQYLKKTEAIVGYRTGMLTKEEYLRALEEAIAITIPDYKALLDLEYPFTHEELMIMMNIANAWAENGCPEKNMKILMMLMRSLDADYMEEEDTINTRLALLNNLSIAYGDAEQHQDAITCARRGIELSKVYRRVQTLPNFYLQISWDMMEQIDLGEREEADREQCRRYLRMGYAVAALSGRTFIKESIENYYKKCFGEDILRYQSTLTM